MAKNYADIYGSSNDSLSLEQRWYAVEETTRGVIALPQNSDFFWTLGGGSISYTQALESSSHRSGRSHVSTIKKKKETSFSFSTYFNIDETLVAASATEIDTANRVFFKSLLGKEYTAPHLKYTHEKAPDYTFSLFEVGDKFARISRAGFIQGGSIGLPGDGEAKVDWTGNAADAYFVGIGKSVVDNSGGNTVTLQAGDADNFPVGSPVMLVMADGVTRSGDTATGTARTVLAVSGNVVTLSGTALTDADGTDGGVYLSYYEPAAPNGINNPVTGLVGSMTVAGITATKFRSATINVQNNHEVVDYVFGTDGLASPFFVPGSRVTSTVTVEANLNAETIKLFNRLQKFEAQALEIVLGNAAGRHMKITLPKIFFKIPGFSVPDSGSIPVSFEGDAYATSLDASDSIKVEFK